MADLADRTRKETRSTLPRSRRRVLGFWDGVGTPQRIALLAVFVLISLASLAAGDGLLLAAFVGFLWATVVAGVWTLVTRLTRRYDP